MTVRETIKQHYQHEAVARRYDRDRFTSLVGRTFDRLEKRAVLSVLGRVRHEIANPAVLDIPCGTGRITEILLREDLTVTGGDISDGMLAIAREKCARFGARASWCRLDLDDLAVGDRHVDLVTCIRLFHHLDSDDRTRILAALARVTRRFVMVNVSFSSPLYRMRRRIKQRLGQGVSRASSTQADIVREAEAAGLRLDAQRFVCPLVSEDVVLLFRTL